MAMILLIYLNIIAQDCKSILKVTTADPSAMIFVNEKYCGKGNVTTEVVKGNYIIAVRESLTKWNGYEIFDTVIVGNCNKEYSLDIGVLKKIFIDSRPQNAAIIENDSVIGYSPQFVSLLQSKKLKLKKGLTLIEVDYNSLTENKIQHFDFQPNVKVQSFADSDLFKILIGSATALGAVAAYFKLKADKKYDDYFFTKDGAILDEVDRYDLYSGVALGLLQVNIGYLIYRIITD